MPDRYEPRHLSGFREIRRRSQRAGHSRGYPDSAEQRVAASMWTAKCILCGNIEFGQRVIDVHPWRRINYLNPLTDSEKIDARRHCGYPAYGGTASGFSSWRFYQVYGLLEYRLSNLAVGEIAVVRTYLGTLSSLEAAIPGASVGLDTDQAAVWTRNSKRTS